MEELKKKFSRAAREKREFRLIDYEPTELERVMYKNALRAAKEWDDNVNRGVSERTRPTHIAVAVDETEVILRAMTVPEVARRLNLSAPSIGRLIAFGQLVAKKEGRRWLIDYYSVERMARRRGIE